MPSCCKWRDFKVWLQEMWKLPTPIDWGEAKEAHGRYCATPGEYYRACEVKYRQSQNKRAHSASTNEEKK